MGDLLPLPSSSPTTAEQLGRVQESLARADGAAARIALISVIQDASSLSDDHLEAAISLCEEGGWVQEALRLTRIQQGRQPSSPSPWLRLSNLYQELGDVERMNRCREQARLRGAPSPSPSPAGDEDALAFPPPSDASSLRFQSADLFRFVELFTAREGVHARQWYDHDSRRGGYSPIREPFGPSVARAHLQGKRTAGVYLVRHDDSVRFCVFDLDLRREAIAIAEGSRERVSALADLLQKAGTSLAGFLGQLGIPFLYEDSGQKGRHFWIFFGEPVPSSLARDLGTAVRRAWRAPDPSLAVEFFPKQDRVQDGGLGNLVKLPLGIHQATGKRAWLLRADGTLHPHPAVALKEVKTCSVSLLQDAIAALWARAPWGDPPSDPDGYPEDKRSPSPPPPQPTWTEADFRDRPDFARLLGGCAVLRRLVQRALAGDPLQHDDLQILRFVLGHLEEGPLAVNFLLHRLPVLPEGVEMGRRLRGNPMSCQRIRQRVPGLAAKVGCQCDFGRSLSTYPHPLLHLPVVEEAVSIRDVASPGEELRGGEEPDGEALFTRDGEAVPGMKAPESPASPHSPIEFNTPSAGEGGEGEEHADGAVDGSGG